MSLVVRRLDEAAGENLGTFPAEAGPWSSRLTSCPPAGPSGFGAPPPTDDAFPPERLICWSVA